MADERRDPGSSAAGGVEPRVWVLTRDHVWPAAIVIGLVLVALVNFSFIYIAVSGADEVAPSYVHGPR